MTTMRYTISRLPNRLIRLWDCRCSWAVVYSADGSARRGGGGWDCEIYRAAVAEFIRGGR